MNKAEISEFVNYDPLTGIFTWKVRPDSMFTRQRIAQSWNKRYAGKVIKNKCSGGYIRIVINGKAYQAHRLAWVIVHDSDIENWIDHINGNKADNRIENLRLATPAQNAMNAGANPANTTGVRGVYYQKNKNVWTVSCCIRGVRNWLGRFDNLLDAAAARKSFEASNYGEFMYQTSN